MNKQSIVDELDAQLAVLEEAMANVQHAYDLTKGNLEAVRQTRALYDGGVLKVKREREPKEVTNRAYDLLKGVGHPLSYTSMYDILTAMGVEIGGQKPPQNLIAHMSGDSRFKGSGDGVWGLDEWPDETQPPPAPVAATSVRPAPSPLTPEQLASLPRVPPTNRPN